MGKVNASTKFLARKFTNLIYASSLAQYHFDYAISSWCSVLPKLLKNKLQMGQNKLIRVVLRLGPHAHVGRSHFQQLYWLLVEARVTQIKLCMVHRIIHNNPSNYLRNYFPLVRNGHSHNTKGSTANVGIYRLNNIFGKCTFAYQDAWEWNKLALQIKQSV